MDFYKDYFSVDDFANANNIDTQLAYRRLLKMVRKCEAEYITCCREDRVQSYKMFRLLE